MAAPRPVMSALAPTSTPAPRPSLWEWAQASLLAGNLAWTVLCLGGYRAETRLVTFALLGALLVVHFLARAVAPSSPAAASGSSLSWAPPTARRRLHPAGWYLIPFLAYAALNVLWITPVPWLGWIDWLEWALLIAAFWVTLNGVTSRGPRRLLFFTLVGLGLVGVALACYQRFVRPDWIMLGRVAPGDLEGRASGPFGIPNSFAGFLLLILPACGAFAFRRSAREVARVWWGWVTAVLLLGLLLTISRGAWMALALALCMWPLVAVRGGWWRRMRIAAVALLAVGAVGAVAWWQSPKVRARFAALVLDSGERTRPILWGGAWKLFREEPLTGTGAGSYNIVFERHRPERFPDEPLWAHNEYLNTLSDYGALGFLLSFGAGAVIAVRCARVGGADDPRRRDWPQSRFVAAALGAGLLAFGLQAALDFHFKLPGLALAFAVVAGLAVSRLWPAAEDNAALSSGSGSTLRGAAAVRIFKYGIAAACGVGVIVAVLPRVRAEALRQEARRALDGLARAPAGKGDFRAVVPHARELLAHATDLDPRNGQAWSDLAYATTLLDLVDPGKPATYGRQAEAAATRALACTELPAEFWVRRGAARDAQGRWTDAGEDYLKAVKLAPRNPLIWFLYAEHLHRFSGAHDAAIIAVEACLRLDPGFPPGVALRQRLAIKSKPN